MGPQTASKLLSYVEHQLVCMVGALCAATGLQMLVCITLSTIMRNTFARSATQECPHSLFAYYAAISCDHRGQDILCWPNRTCFGVVLEWHRRVHEHLFQCALQLTPLLPLVWGEPLIPTTALLSVSPLASDALALPLDFLSLSTPVVRCLIDFQYPVLDYNFSELFEALYLAKNNNAKSGPVQSVKCCAGAIPGAVPGVEWRSVGAVISRISTMGELKARTEQ